MIFNNPVDTEKEGQDIRKPVPAGMYNVQVESTEDKNTKTGGVRTLYTFSILDGDHKGRKLFASFNVICPGSRQAEDIARRDIARLGLACGVNNIRDTVELVRCCCRVKVTVVPPHDQYDESNEIVAYEKYAGPAIAVAGSQGATEPAAAAPVKKATPW